MKNVTKSGKSPKGNQRQNSKIPQFKMKTILRWGAQWASTWHLLAPEEAPLKTPLFLLALYAFLPA